MKKKQLAKTILEANKIHEDSYDQKKADKIHLDQKKGGKKYKHTNFEFYKINLHKAVKKACTNNNVPKEKVNWIYSSLKTNRKAILAWAQGILD